MKSNVAEMTKNLESMRKNAVDDTTVVEALRADAVHMKAELIQRLSQYDDIIIHRSEAVQASLECSLTDLQSVIMKMKLPEDEDFYLIMNSFGVSRQNKNDMESVSKLGVESGKPLNGTLINKKTWGKLN